MAAWAGLARRGGTCLALHAAPWSRGLSSGAIQAPLHPYARDPLACGVLLSAQPQLALGQQQQPTRCLARTSLACSPAVRSFLSSSQQPPSKVYQERRLIGYSPEQLYAVVAAVEHYHQFVPWCKKSQVTKQDGDTYLEADLEVGFQVFVERYTSQVDLQPPTRVHSSVKDSALFDHLESTWSLTPGPPGTCWLAFKVDFAFRSALYSHVAEVFFSEVVQRMMAAFEQRCCTLYGPSLMARGAKRPPPGSKSPATLPT